jgi:Ca-activated chloride channel family protein
MENFRFAKAELAWLLLIIPMLVVIASFAKIWAQKKLARFALQRNMDWILGANRLVTWHARNNYHVLAILFAIIALMRPQGNPTIEDVQTDGLDIIVALDVSRSMDAEDINPSRLRKAKKSIQILLERLGSDRVGIVAFAGSAFLVCPLTSDYEVVKTFLQSIDTNLLSNQGTNIDGALNIAMNAFSRGAKNQTSEDIPSHIIIVMSDGEETSGSALKFAKEARANGTIIHALAYGTERGVPIPIRDSNGVLQGHKRDASGETVLSRVNPAALQALAQSGGGIFSFSNPGDEEIEAIFKNSLEQQRISKSTVQTKLYREYFWLPLTLALIFFLAAFFPVIRWTSKKSFLLLLITTIPASYAEEQKPPTQIKLPWYSAFWDRQKIVFEEAKQFLAANDPAQVSRVLQEEQARSTGSTVLDYNAATAMAHEGRREEAEHSLSEATLKADKDLSPYAWFNLGGLAAKDKDTGASARALYESIKELEAKPTLTEDERQLLTQARKNIEIISDPQKQPQDSKEEEKKQEPQDQKKDDSGKPDKPEEKDGDDKKPSDDKESQPSQKKSNKPQPFAERQDLSEQDAKRILESLKAQEIGLQKKLLKDQFNNEKGEAISNGKDW